MGRRQHIAHGRFQLLEQVYIDVRYAFNVCLFVRQDDKIIMLGGGAKQEIKIRNQLPPSPQADT